MDYLISIIIPVYNIEKYINQCVNSVLNQSYKKIEIILVDDGSKDKTSIICDDFCNLDDRIQVIHKKNEGSSSARNIGILKSKGEYIIFLDGDDYWDDSEFLNKAINNLKESKASIINFGFKKLYENTNQIEKSQYVFDRNCIDFRDKKTTLKYLISNNLYISSSCNKIIKKDLILKNKIFFRDDLVCEDIEWSARLLIHADVLDVINISPYVYRQRKDSKTHTFDTKNVEDLIKSINLCIYYEKEVTKYNNEYMGYIAFQYVTLLIIKNFVDKKKLKQYKSQISNLSFLLKYDLNKRVYIFNFINKYFGFNLLNFFIKIYMKIKKIY